MVNKRGSQPATKADLDIMRADLDLMRSEFKTDVSGLKTDVSNLQASNRNIAMTVAGHTEEFKAIRMQLRKLDDLDGLKKSVEMFTSEIIASRRERALADKSFRDQQETLSDHELRLTRLELRGKQA